LTPEILRRVATAKKNPIAIAATQNIISSIPILVYLNGSSASSAAVKGT